MENSVDPGSTLFTREFISSFMLRGQKYLKNISKEHKGVIRLPQVIISKALVCFGKNYSSLLDFTRNYLGRVEFLSPDAVFAGVYILLQNSKL